MNNRGRRKFLQTSSLLFAAAFAGWSFDERKKSALLSFSTLGCPDWDFNKITDFALQHNYSGIEVRGIQRQMDLTKCKEFSSENMTTTLAVMKDKKLHFSDLGSSAMLHHAEGAERQKNLDEARRFIDLAQQINCPYIRVFPNIFPKDQDRNETMELVIKGLTVLGDHAKETNVTVLMETHGDFVKTEDVEKIMQSVVHPSTGLVWDIANMWTITKESPAEVHKKLKQWIRHTRIKDARMVDGKPQYTLLGKGEVPLHEAIKALTDDGYKGYYSFEWEKLWHPEIGEPEIALADYPIAMKQYL